MSEHTPAPWEWRGYPGRLRLSAGSNTVMDFMRVGFRDAGPRFNTGGLMDSADEFVRFEVAPDVVGAAAGKASERVYRYDVCGVDHPDARLIKAAPEMYDLLRMIASERGDFSSAAQSLIDSIRTVTVVQ